MASVTQKQVAHTQGPWRISGAAEGAGITIEAKRHTLVAFVRDNQHPLTDVTEHEATANARLIAAAPDLLAALHVMAAIIDMSCDGFPVQFTNDQEAVKEVRAAIAKAERAA